ILIESARAVGHEPWLVSSSRALNEHLPRHVARRFLELLRETRGTLEGGRVFLLGFAYKGWPPTDDMRGAPVLPMLGVLSGAGLGVASTSIADGFAGADGVLVVTDHPEYAKLDLQALLASLRKPALVYDCWRILDEETVRAAEVRYAGIGYG